MRPRAVVVLLLGLAAPALAQDREAFADGVRLLRAGQPKQALVRLKAAEKSLAADELPASLLADLAVAAWQAGEIGEAEGYAERAAARDGSLDFLRDTIVGGVRLEEARQGAADPQQLAGAKEKAERAVAAFERALGRRDSEEARRNLERALKVLAEIEEKQKQQEQEKEKEKEKEQEKEQEKKDDEKKQDESKDQKQDQKQDQKNEQDQKQDDAKEGQEKQDEKKPEEQPKPADDKKDETQQEQQPDQQKADQQKAQPQQADKGQKPPDGDKPRLISPEEAARLERLLEEIEKNKKELRLKLQPKHTPGKKDW